MTTYVDFLGPNFTLKVPSDWMVIARPDIQAMFVEPNRDQPLRANLIITERPVLPNVTVDEVLTNARAAQQSAFPGYELLSESDIQVGQTEGKYQLYSWFNPEDGVSVMQAQALLIDKQLLISMTATANVEDDDKVTPVFNEMFSSFNLRS